MGVHYFWAQVSLRPTTSSSLMEAALEPAVVSSLVQQAEQPTLSIFQEAARSFSPTPHSVLATTARPMAPASASPPSPAPRSTSPHSISAAPAAVLAC